MLNAEPIGGKKGSRWRDDVWTLKYLPRFKWHMLTEQIGASSPTSLFKRAHACAAHEAAVHRERLRIELAQSKTEQRDYMHNVELARVLKKREEKRKAKGDGGDVDADKAPPPRKRKEALGEGDRRPKRPKTSSSEAGPGMDAVLSSIF